MFHEYFINTVNIPVTVHYIYNRVWKQLQCCRNSSDLSDNRTFFQNFFSVPDQMSDKNFPTEQKISSSVIRNPRKNGGGLGKTKTNVKKSRFGGGTNSKQCKIRSKSHRALISHGWKSRRPCPALEDGQMTSAELRDCDLRLCQTIKQCLSGVSFLSLK